jgi:hypothetical protein
LIRTGTCRTGWWCWEIRRSTDPWAWRINGHHLLAQATVVGDQVNGVPHFFGAEPATVLEGPHAGLRALPREADLARELMLTLQQDQQQMAQDRGQGTRGHRLPLGPGGCATGAAARRLVRTAGPVAA